LPKYIYEHLIYNKYGNILQRLGIKKYHFDTMHAKSSKGNEVNAEPVVIWIHAVSLGEVRAAKEIITKIKERLSNSYIIVSSITDTGHKEAADFDLVDQAIHMPIDFSFVMRRILRDVRPKIVIIIETDFWYNFLRYAKEVGAMVYLVSGKISKRSRYWYKFFSLFSIKLFNFIDYFLMQNETHMKRLLSIGIDKDKVDVVGNLKFDFAIKHLSNNERVEWLKRFKIGSDDKVITVASTHGSEEKIILAILKGIVGAKVLLAPRHPERFLEVERVLKKLNISYALIDKIEGGERVILVNKMGMLNVCYGISEIAIVGGSFIKGVGGHNILEPIFLNIPVIFGPHMEKQTDFVEMVEGFKCGKTVSVGELRKFLNKFFNELSIREGMKDGCHRLIKEKPEVLSLVMRKLFG
jgi:3-deoxy-D-manno-octulosonic-acid transferase